MLWESLNCFLLTGLGEDMLHKDFISPYSTASIQLFYWSSILPWLQDKGGRRSFLMLILFRVLFLVDRVGLLYHYQHLNCSTLVTSEEKSSYQKNISSTAILEQNFSTDVPQMGFRCMKISAFRVAAGLEVTSGRLLKEPPPFNQCTVQ